VKLTGKDLAPVGEDNAPEDLDSFFLAGYLYQEKVHGVRCALCFDSKGQPSFIGKDSPPKPRFRTSPGPVETVFDGVLTGEGYHVFDLLALSGEDLRWEPLSWRLSGLDELRFPDWLWCVTTVYGAEQGRRLHSYVLNHGGDGLVRKNPTASYWLSEWVEWRQALTLDLILMSVDEHSGSAEVGERIDGSLRWVGKISGMTPLESHLAASRLGAVVEVHARARATNGELRQGRFLRFRFDLPTADAAGPRPAC
jgi:hypothetical protein